MQRSDQVLVVDVDGRERRALKAALDAAGFAVVEDPDVEAAIRRLEASDDFGAVVADADLAPTDGYALLSWVRDRRPDLPVVLLTTAASIETAVRAIHGGAHDILRKPCRGEELVAVLRRAVRQRGSPRVPGASDAAPGRAPFLVGSSPPMVEVYRQVARAARSDSPVLVEGESGTGKELVARAIHAHSARRERPLVTINCGALSDPLLESELFGHVRGAFTGAERARKGLFAEADQGSLFLDEIGEISPRLQVQLLRVLQDGEVRPVGSDHVSRVDVRVIAATHRDLAAAVQAGRFRQDLYYRLKVIVVRVPPLRDRAEDIPALVDCFLARSGRPLTIDDDALTLLQAWPWPGNVRELENVIASAAAMSPGPVITPFDLPPEIRGDDVPGPSDRGVRTLAEVERDYARRILHRCQGNKTHAARLLGIDRKTLNRVLARP